MEVKFDFSEFYEFADKLKTSYELDTAFMTVTQNIARVLHQYLLNTTPVITGNLRKMWSAGDNLSFTVQPVTGGYEVTLINEAQTNKGFQYGLAVNDGHRTPSDTWVMGRFFVEKSILLTSESKQIESIVSQELQKWWDSL